MSKDKVIFKDIKSNDFIVWNNINEATITGGSGAYKPPISPGLKLWDKTSLDPYIEPLSKYVSAELQYDSYDGIMDSKNIKTKEHNAIKISNELKKRQQNQDDDGLGAGRVSISSVGGTSNNVSEDVETLINLLTEDLAVWFGTKKKPKGSKQPKGPWVNICRKVDGKHPPCGRPDTSKGAYPKCRAAGVAGKMSDSQKKAACSQKRRAEKKDTQTGKGQKPVYTSYKPKKESLINKEVIIEKFKVEPHEYIKLFENDDFLLVIPLTFEASCKYGAGTKWCTTSRDNDDMFKKHNRMGSLGYIVIKNKELQDKLESTKFGMFINKPGENYLGGRYPSPQGIVFYNDLNDPMNDNKVLNLFDRVDKYGQLMTMVRMFTDYSEDKFKKMDDLRIS
jgi:hypothetical protein